MGSYMSDDSFSEDDIKLFVTFKGCMEAKIASVGKGTADRPFNHLVWFNDVEKQLSGSPKDNYVAARARILLMKRFCPEREAVPAVASKRSKAPTYDEDHNKLTDGTPEVLAVAALDWRPQVEYPIDDPSAKTTSELC